MLTIQQLQVKYQDFTALKMNQDITIQPYDRVGVIGANGAGKTTLIKACLGMVSYEGSIQCSIKPEEMAVHMQHNGYVDTMSVKHIMETILQTIYQKNQQLQELVRFFQFESSLNKKYKQLSGGQKQRFTLILVLMQDAPITFFDEVTTGLDFETRQALMGKIVSWYQDKQAAILFVTHYYEELEQLTNKLLILDQGKVIDYGERQQLFEKYCGHSVIIFQSGNEHLCEGYRMLLAPANSVAVACANKEEEQEIASRLIDAGINFKRSDHDIEILTMNAIGGRSA